MPVPITCLCLCPHPPPQVKLSLSLGTSNCSLPASGLVGSMQAAGSNSALTAMLAAAKMSIVSIKAKAYTTNLMQVRPCYCHVPSILLPYAT